MKAPGAEGFTADLIRARLDELADPATAAVLQRFFKTGPGEYGEGDRFRGIRVPALRGLARTHRHLSLPETERLLQSPFHEDRLLSLFILMHHFSGGDAGIQESVYRLYIANTHRINSWDLVDASAPNIVGAYLWDKARDPLYELVCSPDLWERRIAVLATFYFIRRGRFAETLDLAQRLLSDRQDLIHKAVGWMLREIGKRDKAAETDFLDAHCGKMPRTMLRYAIEKFPEGQRQCYLKGGAEKYFRHRKTRRNDPVKV